MRLLDKARPLCYQTDGAPPGAFFLEEAGNVNTFTNFLMAPTAAYAMARPGGGGGEEGPSFLFSLAPFFLVFAIIYFLMIRPQQKKQQEHQAMLSAIKEGDSVVASGILGEITKIKDDVVTVKVADNMRLRVLRSSITNLTAQETGGEKAKSSEAKSSE